MRKILFALPLAALALGTAAHADAMDTVKARQAYFKSLGGVTKAFGELTKAYDADAAKAQAAKLQEILATDTAPLFAAGTSDEDFPGDTRALAKIWSNMDDFGAKGKAMHEAGAALIAAAGEGPDAFNPAFGKFAGTCKACHDDYRLPE